jgi:hypothetical protein
MIVGTAAIQIHEAFQHRAVDCSRGVIHDDSKPAITTEVSADDQLGLLLPTSGPLDLRHRRIVPPEPSDAHPLIGIMPVIEDHSAFGLGVMPVMQVIEAQSTRVLKPRDHLHNKHDSAFVQSHEPF